MSALGHKQTLALQKGMSALRPEIGHRTAVLEYPLKVKADITSRSNRAVSTAILTCK